MRAVTRAILALAAGSLVASLAACGSATVPPVADPSLIPGELSVDGRPQPGLADDGAVAAAAARALGYTPKPVL